MNNFNKIVGTAVSCMTSLRGWHRKGEKNSGQWFPTMVGAQHAATASREQIICGNHRPLAVIKSVAIGRAKNKKSVKICVNLWLKITVVARAKKSVIVCVGLCEIYSFYSALSACKKNPCGRCAHAA